MSMTGATSTMPISLMPGLGSDDPVVNAWVAQVTLRLRREIAWLWHQRAQRPDPNDGTLPPVVEAATENLNLIRWERQRQHFFITDVTARYLTDEIDSLRPTSPMNPGRWSFVVENLGLNEAAQFVLAVALASRMDAALAPLFATCMNDLSRPYPTLALAQRLWNDPLTVIECADSGHPLYRYGLLADPGEAGSCVDWLVPIEMPALVSRSLLHARGSLPDGLHELDSEGTRALSCEGRILADRLATQPPDRPQVVPMIGPRGTAFAAWASTLASRTGRPVVRVAQGYPLSQHNLRALATFCWIRGFDLLLPEDWSHDGTNQAPGQKRSSLNAAPIRWYVPLYDQGALRTMESFALTPPLRISGLSFGERVAAFHRGLPDLPADLDEAVEECARRFRFQEKTIAQITETFSSVPLRDDKTLIVACRNEAVVEMDGLAQFVTPRFAVDELVLPPARMKQFLEILTSMRHLTRVHYHWSTAAAWNESGLSVLFHGPPGTGKTMSAEVLSKELDLPMYRIDLSQVVNKYIGETEKNLKRIFDAAETCDCILFFDEADALFGKRTEVKDAHDRFANIEISYLLERMERFKGLAILATNRRKDLDEAFLRRLRYVVEFPLPGVQERERIWRQSFPPGLDVSDVEFSFVAQQFQLSGGHIRSVAFNACLLSAETEPSEIHDDSDGTVGRIPMKNVLLAVKRELEKMNRVANDEVFGPYCEMMREEVV